MKVVKQIFFDDCKSLIKNFFALVIAIGICFLPALYAWFNIYSNWDPYGNTGSLKIAAVSSDKGYRDDDGVFHNVGYDIIMDLKTNTSVDWQFVETEQEAINGVYDGTYYAALVIDENFTYDMYKVFADGANEPTLHFYQNQKKNPVANKIGDTVMDKVKTNVNKEFVSVVTAVVFEDATGLYDDLQEEGGVDKLIEKLKTLETDLEGYEKTIGGIIAGNEILTQSLGAAEEEVTDLQKDTKKGSESLYVTAGSLGDSKATLSTFKDQVNGTVSNASATLLNMQTVLGQAMLTNDAIALANAAKVVAGDGATLNKDLTALGGALAEAKGGVPDSTVEILKGASEELSKQLNQIANSSNGMASTVQNAEYSAYAAVGNAYNQVVNMQNYLNNNVIPQISSELDSLQRTVYDISGLMWDMSDTLGSMNTVFGALGTTVTTSSQSLEKTNEALKTITERLHDVIEKVETADESEQVQALVNALAGDPDAYGEFFSEPVGITTNVIYPIENYGSAVAPFYTTLAIWVGALILTAIIKVKPDEKKYKGATHAQLYFGRYALYFVLAMVQAVVIMIGNVYVFKIQCLHPGWYLFACCCTGLTFSLLIYSLVVTWGDVGKALSVVIVVLQIAGSSGTYPIELLPEFFQKVYIFFPFPYAINAMRETLCGFYEMDFVIYLLQLSCFIIVSLVIGLLLKIPFERLNHFFEERMEDTEMM